MELRLEGIVVIVGNYGSGKSEVAVNLAVHHRQAGAQVRIADLDLVNPYFRSREAAAQLAQLGIELMLPPQPYVQSELPVLSPAVAGLIRRPGDLAILDVGGDNVGAMVLAALGDAFVDRRRQVRLRERQQGARELPHQAGHAVFLPASARARTGPSGGRSAGR